MHSLAGVSIVTFCLVGQMAQAQLHNLGMLNQDNYLVESSLREIEVAHEQTRYLFQTATTNDQKERLRYVNDRLDRAESLLRQALSQPQPPTHPQPPPFQPPQQGGQVEMFRSDRCDGSLSAIISTHTNCEALSTEGSAWAVNINGQCKDLSDTSLRLACRSLRGVLSTPNVEIYKSDRCDGSLVAIVDRYTQCQSLAGMADAWAIKVNGQCQDISDMNVVTACERFKP